MSTLGIATLQVSLQVSFIDIDLQEFDDLDSLMEKHSVAELNIRFTEIYDKSALVKFYYTSLIKTFLLTL